METKDKKPSGIRILNSLCAMALLGVVVYVAIAGVDALALGVLALALAGVTAPVVASADGFLDVLAGVLEALTEGIVAVFEAIVDAISGLFG